MDKHWSDFVALHQFILSSLARPQDGLLSGARFFPFKKINHKVCDYLLVRNSAPVKVYVRYFKHGKASKRKALSCCRRTHRSQSGLHLGDGGVSQAAAESTCKDREAERITDVFGQLSASSSVWVEHRTRGTPGEGLGLDVRTEARSLMAQRVCVHVHMCVCVWERERGSTCVHVYEYVHMWCLHAYMWAYKLGGREDRNQRNDQDIC